jgi:hypothetical protein
VPLLNWIVGVDRGSITTVICAAALFACGCGGGGKRAPAIAEAYVGPATLKIRSDFPVQSSTVAVVKHGDRLEIIQRRRKFLKVRTPAGSEGWTEENQLLNAADMQDLKDLAARAAKLPSQGVATTYGELNIHTQPLRTSPSFLQIKEGDRVDVLTHVITPQTDAPRRPLIPPPPKKIPPPKKPPKESKIPAIPLPVPPGPPPNWLDLSKTDLEDEEPPDQPEAKPVPTDDWTLVRLKTGQSGWARTRRISMAIPDEVAQYAEGRRIVSYFPLGYTQDGDVKKPTWLWTTIGGGHQPYDFDSFRVFIWSLRRHRYETAYIERNLQGHSPVVLNDVDYATGGAKGAGQPAAAKYPGFSVCVEKPDGLHRRDYALLGNVVRYAGERACEPQTPVWIPKAAVDPAAPVPAAAVPAPPREGMLEQIKKRVKGLFQKKR